MKIRLATTEVLDGEKKRPGAIVELPADHPVAVKTLAADPGAAVQEPAPAKQATLNKEV